MVDRVFPRPGCLSETLERQFHGMGRFASRLDRHCSCGDAAAMKSDPPAGKHRYLSTLFVNSLNASTSRVPLLLSLASFVKLVPIHICHAVTWIYGDFRCFFSHPFFSKKIEVSRCEDTSMQRS